MNYETFMEMEQHKKIAEQEAKSEMEAIFGKIFPKRAMMIKDVMDFRKKIKCARMANAAESEIKLLYQGLGYIGAFFSLELINSEEYKKLRKYLEGNEEQKK